MQLHRFIITLRGRTGYLRPELEEEPIRGENCEGGSKAAEGNAGRMLWCCGTTRSCARSTALGNAAGMPGAVGGIGP